MGKRSESEVRNLELKGYTSKAVYDAAVAKCKRIGLSHSSAVHCLFKRWVEEEISSSAGKDEWSKLGQVFGLPAFGSRVNYGSSPARLRP
jgi:hypothetical protein